MGASDAKGANGKGSGKWQGTRSTISWSAGPADTMREVIGRITDNGAAVLFARTSDGGALVIQVLAGTERSKEYITVHSDILPCFDWLVDTYG